MENTNIPKPDLPQIQIPKPEIQKPEAQKPEAQAKPGKSKLKTYFLYVLVAGVGIIIAKFAFDFLGKGFKLPLQIAVSSKKPGLLPLIKITPPPATAPAALAPVAPKNTEPFSAIKKKVQQTVTPYILNGVYFSQGKSYALINNQIVEEGDRIEEATVVKISLETVELQVKDRTVKLTIRGK
jgi:hypothetical protein